MDDRIPLYSADGRLTDLCTVQRITELVAAGTARASRSNNGRLRRAYLFGASGSAGESGSLADFSGQRYSHNRKVEEDPGHGIDGNPRGVWALRRIPDFHRPYFTAVRDGVSHA